VRKIADHLCETKVPDSQHEWDDLSDAVALVVAIDPRSRCCRVRQPIGTRDAPEDVPAHYELVRVLTILTLAMGVSAEQEANWPRLAAAAMLAAEEGREPVPAVWFRTDEGARGLIPVSELTPVTFTDEKEPARFLGTVTALGPDAAPST
jgi:hypothetical protein